jgi:putative hemolysin
MRVEQVMIPIEQVAMLSVNQSLADAIVTAHIDAHTRYPVCEEHDPNRIIGYVNFKEMVYTLRTNPQDATLRGIVRPVRFIGPNEEAAELFRTFVDDHAHIAIVRNDGGETLGMITLEDLVEELVGDLEDEFDRLPRMFHALSTQVWMIGGGVSVQEINATLGKSLPEPQQTVSRWLLQRLNSPPRPGDTYSDQGLTFSIRRIRRGKIFEVSVRQQSK